MKALPVVLALALLFFTPLLYAQDTSKVDLPFQRASVEQTEQSLKQALESKSPGLQMSAALTVREMKSLMPKRDFTSLIIPLMGLVKDEQNEESVRVIAALALHDLRSARGDYAISQLAQTSNSENLKRMCQWLSYYVLKEKKPEYATQEGVK